MLFNILSCILAWFFGALFWGEVYTWHNKDVYVDRFRAFLYLSSFGTLLVFMWMMSWLNWWR